jgi:hypothetical protein
VDAERGRRPSGSGDDSYDSDTSFVDNTDDDSSYVNTDIDTDVPLSELNRGTGGVPELSRETTERNTDIMYEMFDMFPSQGANTATVAPGEMPPEWFTHEELPDIVRGIRLLHPTDYQVVIQRFIRDNIADTPQGRPRTIRAMNFENFSELANAYIDFNK